ncbi:MAG TPA: divalent-cation tolerance protein CutA [bacterium]|nr:divalent-cation tolerance protein CutA [bacterium]
MAPHDHSHDEHEHDFSMDSEVTDGELMDEDEDRGYLLVSVTFPDLDTATRVATELVDSQLAACVNLIPQVTSIYRWEGQIKTEAEVLALIKTADDLLGEVAALIEETHPYEVPEVLALPLVAGSPDYVDWMAGQLRPPVELEND